MTGKRPDIGMLKDPGHLISFGFGSGFSPVAPGTMGTIVGVVIFLLIVYSSLYCFYLYLSITGLLFSLGIYLSDRTSKALGTHDHGSIVVDEIVGFLLAAAWMPWLSYEEHLDGIDIFSIFLTFVLFRFFDIVKPWPVSWIDRRCRGGLGIMLDDVAAALYVLVVVFVLALFLGLPVLSLAFRALSNECVI